MIDFVEEKRIRKKEPIRKFLKQWRQLQLHKNAARVKLGKQNKSNTSNWLNLKVHQRCQIIMKFL
jgi:hypothetical protein